jgi:hypothetical protein
MLTKMKICAGADGVAHEAYIYKNIDGKKYCKSCAFKLQKPKTIKKMSEKQIFKMTLKKQVLEEDIKFYEEIWNERTWRDDSPGWLPDSPPQCEVCLRSLGHVPNIIYFHHILEKRNYPSLRHVKKNIAIVCPTCHSMYETFPDKVPYLKKRREDLQKDPEIILLILNQ